MPICGVRLIAHPQLGGEQVLHRGEVARPVAARRASDPKARHAPSRARLLVRRRPSPSAREPVNSATCALSTQVWPALR